jgi:hypothetical protein
MELMLMCYFKKILASQKIRWKSLYEKILAGQKIRWKLHDQPIRVLKIISELKNERN